MIITATTANRHSSWPRLVALLAALLLQHCSAYHETLTVPKEYRDNFEEKAVAYVPAPTDMEFTPDGKYLFVTSKFGKIWRLPVSEMDDKNVDAEDVEVEEVFEIPHRMCTNGARGLGALPSTLTIQPSPTFMCFTITTSTEIVRPVWIWTRDPSIA